MISSTINQFWGCEACRQQSATYSELSEKIRLFFCCQNHNRQPRQRFHVLADTSAFSLARISRIRSNNSSKIIWHPRSFNRWILQSLIIQRKTFNEVFPQSLCRPAANCVPRSERTRYPTANMASRL